MLVLLGEIAASSAHPELAYSVSAPRADQLPGLCFEGASRNGIVRFCPSAPNFRQTVMM